MVKRVGVNLEGWRSNATARMWTDPAVLALLPSLHLGYGRWPGGTTANYTKWRDGSFAASGNPAEGIVRGQPKPGIPYTGWLAVTNAANCANLVQVNLCTEPSGKFVVDSAGIARQVADQTAFLAAIVATGATVPYVELGNEMYRRADPACQFYAADPAAYVEMCGQMTAAIRTTVPSARVGACSLLDIYHHLNPDWRAVVEPGLAGVVDAYTYHHYLPIPAAPNGTNSDALVADALADFAHAYRTTLDTIPAGRTAWLTEWQYNERDQNAAAMAGSAAHGLMVAALLAAHLAEPSVELTGPHATLGSGGVYPAIFDTTSGPVLSTYGQALGAVGWLLDPVGPPPPPLPPG